MVTRRWSGRTWPLQLRPRCNSASQGGAHRVNRRHGRETLCLSAVDIRKTLNSKVRKLKSLDSAWKLFKKLEHNHGEHKKEVCMGGRRQESMGESNKMVKRQDIVRAKQVPFKK